MRPARFSLLVDKAVQAAIAAIEVYNKPSFSYREEAFAILMINAWELILKARILKENNNRMRSIEVWEPIRKKDGTLSQRFSPRKNRTGNQFTISLQNACQTVRGYSRDGIDDLCIHNLDLLLEIRDNAVHLSNKGRNLRKRIQEVGTAALRNFLKASSTWFRRDLSEYDLAIMPLVFESPSGIIQTAFDDTETGAAGRLLALIAQSEAAFPFDPARPFNVAVEMDVRFVRRASPDALLVQVDAPTPGAIPIIVTEEQVLAAYQWNYDTLSARLSERYSDFKRNDKYHQLRRRLEADRRYCKKRSLDPGNPRTATQKFYNPNIVREFDRHYTVRE
jgi:hypothetical protein